MREGGPIPEGAHTGSLATSILTELLIILALILVNGVFAAAEIAVVALRSTRIRELEEDGVRRARPLRQLREEPERFLATVQIGITVVGATAAAFGGASLAGRLAGGLRALGLEESAEELALTVVVGGISYLSLVLGELVPKSLALRFAEPYALRVARPLRLLSSLMRPVVWLLTASSNLVLRFFGDRTSFSESRLSPEELQQMVEEASRTGSLDPGAGEIASRAFDFADVSVAALMVPRPDIKALPHDATPAQVRQLVREEGHSRMPVYEGTIDNVIGYVVAKDLLALCDSDEHPRLADIIRPAFFLPVTARAAHALRELQRMRQQLAIVVDEQGGVEGLVTIEDLVEELVGDIFSEDEVAEETVRREADGSVLLPGDTPIHQANRLLDLSLPEDEGATTLAGLVLSHTGTIPRPGTRLALGEEVELEVTDASVRRVRWVRLRMPTRAPAPAPSPPAGA